MAIYLLLPAYNEAAALRKLLPRTLKIDPKPIVMVVDDGSSDATAAVVREFAEVRLLQHEHNKGLGAAFRTLFKAALREADDDDFIVTMDADNTMDPALIVQMVGKAQTADADIVIASRFAGGSEAGVPWLRRLYSRGARLLINTLFPLRGVRDYTCGYRLYRVPLLRELEHAKPNLLDATGFAATVELLLNLSSFRPTIAEVPLDLRYDQKEGKSKMKVLRTIGQYFALVVKLKLRGPLGSADTTEDRTDSPNNPW